MVLDLLKPRGGLGSLADRLLKLPAEEPQAIAEELYLSVLTRRPTLDEVRETGEFLAGLTAEARSTAVPELIWSLMASAEFRFNH